MAQQDEKPTEAEIAHARRILAQEAGATPEFNQSGGLWGMVAQLINSTVPRLVLTAAALVFLGYHAWDYYNEARREPALTEEIQAKAAIEKVKADALNQKIENDTLEARLKKAELERAIAEAKARKAEADALNSRVPRVRLDTWH
jgi:hypothetical protein